MPFTHLTPEDVRERAHAAFLKENIAVFGTGIDPACSASS
jgi:hypothetical protein